MHNINFWLGRRVLITGHTGFKGAWLLLWLNEVGAQVLGIAHGPEPEPNLFRQLVARRPPGDQFRWQHHECDIRDYASLKDIVRSFEPEVVLHLAAQSLVRASYIDPLGTWASNVQGSLNLLEALKPLRQPCAVVMVTTDKVYENREWLYGYRELDRLGGHDPYSASKAAAEIAISSWRSSFCGTASHQTPYLRIATARSGNVIGGGDWAKDRIVPDAMRALANGEPIQVRNPRSTRPWQHVLEPLGGYLRLAEALTEDPLPPCEAFNFGPHPQSNRQVRHLIETILSHWPGEWCDQGDNNRLHEAGLLHLQIDKVRSRLGWQPRWDYARTIERTVGWYRAVNQGECPLDRCLDDLWSYERSMPCQSPLA